MFKKDKITKLIQKEKNEVSDKLKSNDINLLEAHYILEDKISEIYSENKFCYQDLLNRRTHLTSFRANIKEISISLLFGILGSVILNFIIYASNELSVFDPIIYNISMIIVSSLIVFIVLKSIYANAKALSGNDIYNVDSYELNLIEKALQKYEDEKQNYNSSSDF